MPAALRDWSRLLNDLPAAALIADAEGTFMQANDAASELLGRKASWIVGRSYRDPAWSVRAGDHDAGLPFELVPQSTDRIGPIAFYLHRPDGTRVYLSGQAAPIREGGVVAGFVATLHDITKSEQASIRQNLLIEVCKSLRRVRDEDEILLGAARLLVPPFADQCVVDVSRGGLIRRLAVEPTPSSDGWPDVGPAPDVVERVLTTGQAHQTTRVADRTASLRTSGTASTEHRSACAICLPVVPDGEPLAALSMIRFESVFDSSDIRFADEYARAVTAAIETSRLVEKAEESSGAKSTFISVMSHEFRTPLTTIVGYIDLLASGASGDLGTKQLEQVGFIRASAWHLTQLVDEVLTFSRIEAGREHVVIEPFDPEDLLRHVTSMLKPSAFEKELELHVEVAGFPARVSSDPKKVRQILFNLISNAIKFTDAGEIRVRLERFADRVVFTVADTGIGIAREDQERIFQSFWQAELGPQRVRTGTGLGLTITRRLARLLGGDVEVHSQLDVGTLFTVTLPAHPRPSL